MDETTRLKLPYIMAAQAQKHVTHNEALLAADALIQLSVATRSLAAPPAAPEEGARYIVGPGAGGAFAGHSGEIAAFDDGAWRFHAAAEGWRCWVADEGRLLVRTRGAWEAVAAGRTGQAEIGALGIGTAPDAMNRLAVKSDAVLFSHDDVKPGSGDMRVTLNKGAAARDAGIAFQTGFSSRALLGTFGGDAFVLKVSNDGGAFAPMLVAETSGKLALRGPVDPAVPQPIQMSGAVCVAADRLTVEAASGDGVALLLANTANGAHGGYLLSAGGAGAFSIVDQANGARLVVGANGNILPGADNAVTLGEAGKRFAAVYAATGTIQTSDRRDKADIARLSRDLALDLLDAVAPVTFRWREGSGGGDAGGPPLPETQAGSAGASGRRHAGFLAQEVRAGLEAAEADLGLWGLDDPGDAESRQWLRPDQMIAILWTALRETRRDLGLLASTCRSESGSGGETEFVSALSENARTGVLPV